MSRNNPLKEFADILGGDTRQVRLLSVVLLYCASAAFIGLQLRPNPHSLDDMRLILHVAPAWVWSMMFAAIAAARTIGLFMWRGSVLTRTFIPFAGICLWSACFASNIIGNPEEANFAILYLVAAFIECWLMGRGFLELKGALHGA